MMAATAPEPGCDSKSTSSTEDANSLPPEQGWLVRMRDKQQRHICTPWVTDPSIQVTDLPFDDNMGDLYTGYVHHVDIRTRWRQSRFNWAVC